MSLITDPTDNSSPFRAALTAIFVKVESAFTHSTNAFGPWTLSVHPTASVYNKSHQQMSEVLVSLPESSAAANLPALAAPTGSFQLLLYSVL